MSRRFQTTLMRIAARGRVRRQGVVDEAREMKTARRNSRRLVLTAGVLVTVTVLGTSCGPSESGGSASTATTSVPASSTSVDPTTPLTPPKTSTAQDGQYLMDVTEADPVLTSYVQEQGSIAMHALLTDGSAFCAFSSRDGRIDSAMVSVAIGARSVESQTHLPLSVTTFNTMEAVALLTQSPSDQKLIPRSDRVKIRELATALARH